MANKYRAKVQRMVIEATPKEWETLSLRLCTQELWLWWAHQARGVPKWRNNMTWIGRLCAIAGVIYLLRIYTVRMEIEWKCAEHTHFKMFHSQSDDANIAEMRMPLVCERRWSARHVYNVTLTELLFCRIDRLFKLGKPGGSLLIVIHVRVCDVKTWRWIWILLRCNHRRSWQKPGGNAILITHLTATHARSEQVRDHMAPWHVTRARACHNRVHLDRWMGGGGTRIVLRHRAYINIVLMNWISFSERNTAIIIIIIIYTHFYSTTTSGCVRVSTDLNWRVFTERIAHTRVSYEILLGSDDFHTVLIEWWSATHAPQTYTHIHSIALRMHAAACRWHAFMMHKYLCLSAHTQRWPRGPAVTKN